MNNKVYEYMDWPGIEAIVYGEEASPKDIMAPQADKRWSTYPGIFPGSRKCRSDLSEIKKYAMEQAG